MKIYSSFAKVYDRMMDNIPYEEWCDYLVTLLSLNDVSPGNHVVELGCGTGTMTKLLAEAGLVMTGIDLSEDMLEEARLKTDASYNITYLNQNMCSFRVNPKAEAVVSICDSMNYLLKDSQMLAAMKAVHDNLVDGGVFIFDLKTDHFFRKKLGDKTYREEMDGFSYIWRNHYYKDKRIHKYGVKIFYDNPTREPDVEIHYQRAYSIESIVELAQEAGFEEIEVYDAFTMEKPRKRSDRLYFVVKRNKQFKKL